MTLRDTKSKLEEVKEKVSYIANELHNTGWEDSKDRYILKNDVERLCQHIQEVIDIVSESICDMDNRIKANERRSRKR